MLHLGLCPDAEVLQLQADLRVSVARTPLAGQLAVNQLLLRQLVLRHSIVLRQRGACRVPDAVASPREAASFEAKHVISYRVARCWQGLMGDTSK